MLMAGDEPWKKASRYSGRDINAEMGCDTNGWCQADLFLGPWVQYAASDAHGFDQLDVLQIYAQMALFDPSEAKSLPAICS